MFQPPVPLLELVEGSVSTNCPVEKYPTEQLWFKIEPQSVDEPTDPMALLELTKRFMFCTSCGNSRLIN